MESLAALHSYRVNNGESIARGEYMSRLGRKNGNEIAITSQIEKKKRAW